MISWIFEVFLINHIECIGCGLEFMMQSVKKQRLL